MRRRPQRASPPRLVLDRLDAGADARALIAALVDSAEPSLASLSTDARLCGTFAMLARLPRAARDGTLRRVLPNAKRAEESRMSLVSAVASAFDADERERNDVSELAELSTIEVLVGLPEGSPKESLAQVAEPHGFASLVRELCARIAERWALSFLGHELSGRVGERFSSLEAHAEFRQALRACVTAAAATVEPVASEWWSRCERVDEEAARALATAALRAIEEALRVGDDSLAAGGSA